MNVSDLRPYVATTVPDAPNPLIDREIVLAAREVCEEAPLWVEVLTAIPTVNGQGAYTLTHATGDVVRAQRHEVLFGGVSLRQRSVAQANRRYPGWRTDTGATLHSFVLTDPHTLAVIPVPNAALGDLTVTVQLRPKFGATTLPDQAAEDWRDAVVSNAIARLASMPNEPWSAPQVAAIHGQKYQIERAQAVAAHAKGQARGEGRVIPYSHDTQRAS
ncbi:MAG: hypothetical protein L0H83_03465 [Salinisphaera sp.]|nr:hypothetical protein [Salinisphaera sp.]